MDEFVYLVWDKQAGKYVNLNRYSEKNVRKYGNKGAASNSITQYVGRRGDRANYEIHTFKLVRVEE